MQLYNSITNKKEEFNPINENKVNMYVCGPTVYNYIHIGNARPVVFFDIVKRYLEFSGYEVTYASNITDVDDKIINRAIDEKKTEKEIVNFFAKQYFTDCHNVGSKSPDIIPYATQYIDQMICFIGMLIDKGFAYEVDGDVYFRISKAKDYGVLSNQNTMDLEAGSRISVESKKENPLDFTLWKKTIDGIKWSSPWGDGRPGWHTECVVMIDDIFKNQIDIHGGGSDLKFPHHENEIAQACALHDHHLAKYWMHVGRLEIDNQKMSKSEGRKIWLKDLLEQYPYQAFRLFMLSSHYRQPINYTDEIMEQYNKEWEKIKTALKQANNFLCVNNINGDDLLDSVEEFKELMDDDFNTPNVLTLITNVLKKLNANIRAKQDVLAPFNTLKLILSILGIECELKDLTQEEIGIYKAWEEARKSKDFENADKYRDILVNKGIL